MFFITKQKNGSYNVYNDNWETNVFKKFSDVQTDPLHSGSPLTINGRIIVKKGDYWAFLGEDKKISKEYKWIESFMTSGYYCSVSAVPKNKKNAIVFDIANVPHFSYCEQIDVLYDYYLGKISLYKLPDYFYEDVRYIKFIAQTEKERFYKAVNDNFGSIEETPEDLWQLMETDLCKKSAYIKAKAMKFCTDIFDEDIHNSREGLVEAFFNIVE